MDKNTRSHHRGHNRNHKQSIKPRAHVQRGTRRGAANPSTKKKNQHITVAPTMTGPSAIAPSMLEDLTRSLRPEMASHYSWALSRTTLKGVKSVAQKRVLDKYRSLRLSASGGRSFEEHHGSIAKRQNSAKRLSLDLGSR